MVSFRIKTTQKSNLPCGDNVMGLYKCRTRDDGQPACVWSLSTSKYIRCMRLSAIPEIVECYGTNTLGMCSGQESPHDSSKYVMFLVIEGFKFKIFIKPCAMKMSAQYSTAIHHFGTFSLFYFVNFK